jgi:hypothetical protein
MTEFNRNVLTFYKTFVSFLMHAHPQDNPMIRCNVIEDRFAPFNPLCPLSRPHPRPFFARQTRTQNVRSSPSAVLRLRSRRRPLAWFAVRSRCPSDQTAHWRRSDQLAHPRAVGHQACAGPLRPRPHQTRVRAREGTAIVQRLVTSMTVVDV